MSNRTSNLFSVVIFTDAQPLWDWPARCPDGIVLMRGQVERALSGREHFQFYVKTQDRVRFTGVKKMLACHHAHVEPAYKNEEANAAYCTKEETRVRDLPTLKPSSEIEKIHPIDYLMTPQIQLCYVKVAEAGDCGEAMGILLENPSRFQGPRWVDYRKHPSVHSSQCRCMEKYEKNWKNL